MIEFVKTGNAASQMDEVLEGLAILILKLSHLLH